MRLLGLMKWMVFAALAGAATGCEVNSVTDEMSNSRVYRFDGAFLFTGPADLVDDEGQATDSLAGSWSNDAISVFYDFGRYSSNLSEFTAQMTSSREAMLDGREAHFIETAELVAVSVPAVAEGTRFAMIVRFRDPAYREVAQEILQSVKFLR